MTDQPDPKPPKKPAPRWYRKRVELFRLIDTIKLWPSRTGLLHGIRSVERLHGQAVITTHCGRTFTVTNSRNSRAARWLRNKWFREPCPLCGIPEWKLAKYSATRFSRGQGSTLGGAPARPARPLDPGRLPG